MSVHVSARDGVTTLVVDRRPTSTWDLDTVEALTGGLVDAEADAATRVVVLRTEGPTFCAGGEIGGPSGGESVDRHRQRYARAYVTLDATLRRLRLPVVARVQGAANAGGLAVVAGCDVAVAGTSATFATPEVTGGMFPLLAMGLMHGHLTPKRAFAMFYGGRALAATEAVDAGLVTEAVADDELDGRVAEWCARLCAANPDAVAVGRRAYWAMADLPPAARVDVGGRALLELIGGSTDVPDQSYMARALDGQNGRD